MVKQITLVVNLFKSPKFIFRNTYIVYYNWLYLLYNLKLYNMKTCLAEIIFKVWAIGLGLILGIAFCYAVWSVFTGNYSGTACREF